MSEGSIHTPRDVRPRRNAPAFLTSFSLSNARGKKKKKRTTRPASRSAVRQPKGWRKFGEEKSLEIRVKKFTAHLLRAGQVGKPGETDRTAKKHAC